MTLVFCATVRTSLQLEVGATAVCALLPVKDGTAVPAAVGGESTVFKKVVTLSRAESIFESTALVPAFSRDAAEVPVPPPFPVFLRTKDLRPAVALFRRRFSSLPLAFC